MTPCRIALEAQARWVGDPAPGGTQPREGPPPAPPRPWLTSAPILSPTNHGCGHNSAAGICESSRRIAGPEGGPRDPESKGGDLPLPGAVRRRGCLVPPGETAAPHGNGSTDSCPHCHTSRAHPTRHRASRWDTAWTWGDGGGASVCPAAIGTRRAHTTPGSGPQSEGCLKPVGAQPAPRWVRLKGTRVACHARVGQAAGTLPPSLPSWVPHRVPNK